MKISSFLLICAAVAAFMPVQAQGRRTRSSASRAAATAAAPGVAGKDEEAEPKTGVRFVTCSPAGISMPSPLFVRRGKEYKKINIGSRIPSMRVKPLNGIVEFWDKDPGAVAAMENTKKSAASKVPDPVFTITVPKDISSKAVCILIPNQDINKTMPLFINEGDFPRKGMHIINLSSFPLQMTTSEKGDYSDKKESKIGVYRRENGIGQANTWSFKGEKGQQVAFILSYKDKDAKDMKRIKASTFVLSERQAMLNVVVKDASRNVPKLLIIQLPEDKDKK